MFVCFRLTASGGRGGGCHTSSKSGGGKIRGDLTGGYVRGESSGGMSVSRSKGSGCNATTGYEANCSKKSVFNFSFPFSVRQNKVVKNLTEFNSDSELKNWVCFCDKISQYRILRGLRSLKHVTDRLTAVDWSVFIGEVRKNDNNICLFLFVTSALVPHEFNVWFLQLFVATKMSNLAPQNTPKHTIWRSEKSKFYGEGALPPSRPLLQQTPPPRPPALGAFGASIIRPSALDVPPPPF